MSWEREADAPLGDVAGVIAAAAAVHLRAVTERAPLAEWAAAATAETLRLARAECGLRVLDVAGGSGDPAIALARIADVTTIDISPAALAATRARASREGVTLVTAEADAHALPFDSGAFDLVTCSFGLTHFRDASLALREMRRVLAGEGRAIVAVWGSPERNEIHARTFALLGLDGDSELYRFAPEGVLAAELERAGFEVITESRRVLPYVWKGGAMELWRFLQTISPPLAAVADAGAAEVVAGLARRGDGVRIVLEVEVLFVESMAIGGVASASAGNGPIPKERRKH